MSNIRELSPRETLPNLSPGDTLRLRRVDEARPWRVDDADRWSDKPKSKPALSLSGIRGTEKSPVRIEGESNVFLSGGSEFERWRHWSNKIAHKIWQDHWASGQVGQGLPYPGVHKEAGRPENAVLHLRDCRHVIIDQLDLRGAYPTLLLLEDCQNILVRNTVFSAGTFAISIRGGSDLTVEGCRWRQDGWLWRVIAWNRVHYEGISGEVVDIASDFRNFDGSFINAQGTTGSLVVRNCDVGDAFNGVHVFNGEKTTRLRVTGCRFTRIRDNAVEIEGNVEDVTIAHNLFVDPYRPISIDTFEQIGWFYFYGNVSWFETPPGPKTDQNNGGEFFKLPKERKKPKASGPSYVFHNSLVLRSCWSKRGVWPKLTAFANAIDYPRPDESWGAASEPSPELADRMAAPFFGSLALTPDGNQRFAPDWIVHDVRFFDEVVDHHEVPSVLIAAGYGAEGRLGARRCDPGFRAATTPDFDGSHLRLARGSPCSKECQETTIVLPDRNLVLPAGRDIGAWQGDVLFDLSAFTS